MNLVFVTALLLISIGFAGVVLNRNLMKIIISIGVIEAGVNLFLVSSAYREGGALPIFTDAGAGTATLSMALPTAQALTLTSIVIGVSITALLLSFAIVLHKHYGTLDTAEIRRLRE